MRTRILLLLTIVSIQTRYSQVIDNKKETVIVDSVRNIKIQEQAQNELAKQNTAKIKEQKAIKKHQKDFEKMERKGKISPDDEIKWKKKNVSLRERLLKLEKEQEKNHKDLMKLQ